ncbi:MAG: hypothetical protein GX410_07195 [Elusimicrobia bacterium]|nr:hypothetical protein [Elusimicrobiota bacterium]
MTKKSAPAFLLPALLAALLSAPGLSLGAPLCGEAPAQARLDALALPWRHEVTAATLRADLLAVSAANLEELRAAAGELSGAEKEIRVKTLKMMPPFLIHRIGLERLRGVLEMGGIVSTREMQRRAGGAVKPFTPPLEDKLFGGYDCVFVTVGPPQGRPRYGDILLSVKPKTDGSAWASHSSGWTFMGEVRKSTVTLQMPVTRDDELAYSHLILADRDWEQAYPLLIILQLRAKGEARPELVKQLLAMREREGFWNFVDANRLGYLEGKFSAFVPLEDIDRIEVPPAKYDEVMNWPNVPKTKIIKLPAAR